MRKTLAVILAVIMLMGCMTACSSPEAPASSDAAESSTVQETAKAPVNIEVAVAAFNEQAEAHLNELADMYHKDTGNTVEISNMDSAAYKDKLKILVAAGEALPDVFMHWCGGPFISYIKAGACLDITDYINDSGLADYYLPAANAMCEYEGRRYAFGGRNMGVEPCYYNTELFDRYGLEEPKTISELEAICETLKANGIIPFALANQAKWTGMIYYMYLVDRIGGGDLLANAASRTGSFEDPGFTRAGEKLVEWVKKGYFPDGCNGLAHNNNEDLQLLYQEKAAMWMYPGASKIASDNPEFYKKLGVFPFPASDDGKGGNAVMGSPGGTFFSISSQCAHPDEAWKFLTYMATDDYIDGEIAIGIVPATQRAIDKITDPLLRETLEIFNNAERVQLYWDQYLPPALGEAVKTTTQQLIGLEITPEQVGQELEKVAVEEYGY